MVLALAGFAYAASRDIRTREVPDGLWYALAALALALFATDFNERFGGMAWILVAPLALIFVVAVTGGEIITVIPGEPPKEPAEFTPQQARIWRIDLALTVLFLSGAVLLIALSPRLDLGRSGPILAGPLAITISAALMVGAGLLFYLLGVLHGGADAKAFMVLALLFPTPPELPIEPLLPGSAFARAVVPFVMAVLFNAALMLVIVGPAAFLVLGARKRRLKWPESLFGFEKPVEAVNLDREFVMGAVDGGVWKPKIWVGRSAGADDEQVAALDYLKKAGVQHVFVTPKFPFMVYILAGLVFALLVTSPLYLISAV